MDEEINDLYQKNGIAHLLAVSGLHVSLIGMGLYRLLRRLGLGFGWAGVWSGGLLFLYGTMTGFGPSVFRACLMLACSFAASYLGRTYDLLSAMSLAAICLSLENPFVIFTGAFQLSFGAVFAIGWAGKELSDGLECKKEWENALSVSLAIQLVTGPIVLYHFFEYPLYGIFLNFLVIPLMTYVVGARDCRTSHGDGRNFTFGRCGRSWNPVWCCGSGGPSAGAWRRGKHGNLPLHFCIV